MNKTAGVALLLVGILLVLAGQWMAFEVYTNLKLKKVGENVAQFIHGVYSGHTLVKLVSPEENLFVLRSADGKVVTTSNAIGPANAGNYISTSYGEKGITVHAYTKKVSFSEYMLTLLERPYALGVFVSGLVFAMMGLFLLLKEKKSEVSDAEYKEEQEELIKSLKALRLTLAMDRIIPQESLSEAKKILDGIIKRVEGKG